MHVAVIGAGIVGVATAHALAVDGHRVTVFERRGTVAAEASFGHAGLVAPGWVAPPAGPTPWLRRLLRRGGPLRPDGVEPGRLRLQRLAHYSQERLQRLTQTLRLDYERADGGLVVVRTAEALARLQPALAAMGDAGTRFETLDAAGCRAVEPGLSPETPLAAGIWLPGAEVGNCRQFATLLRQEAERLGARFRFHTTVQRLDGGTDPQVTALHAPPDEAAPRGPVGGFADTRPLAEGPRVFPFDAVVVCAALGAQPLLRPHGLRLPLRAVHGHSITAPLRRHELHPDLGPRSAVVDARDAVTITRLGARVRVAGALAAGAAPERIRPAAIEPLHRVLHDWFPGAAQAGEAQHWQGSCATLPDGPPVLGPSGVAGLWLNLGHGSDGWALACGSARLVADRIAGRAPAIDVDGLGVERLVGATP